MELRFTCLSSVESPPHPSRPLCSFGCGSINIIIIVPAELYPAFHHLNSPPHCLEDVVSSHYICWATFYKMSQSPKTGWNKITMYGSSAKKETSKTTIVGVDARLVCGNTPRCFDSSFQCLEVEIQKSQLLRDWPQIVINIKVSNILSILKFQNIIPIILTSRIEVRSRAAAALLEVSKAAW